MNHHAVTHTHTHTSAPLAGLRRAPAPEAGLSVRGVPTVTPAHRSQQTDVVPQRADAAAEGDEEHDHAHSDEDDGRVDQEGVPDGV